MNDPRPCPYCWSPPEEPSMENIDRLAPPEGFAAIHPECQRSLDLYIEEQHRDALREPV